jgi:hypothetical protein
MASYLQSAFERFLLEYPNTKHVGNLRDHYGFYAYVVQSAKNGKRYIFCAKNSQNGVDVSCHLDLVWEAIRMRSDIVMYVNGNTYLFYPQDIFRAKPKRNLFHGATMLNFSILLGKNIKTIGTHRAGASELLPGLFDNESPGAQALVKTFGDVLEPIGGTSVNRTNSGGAGRRTSGEGTTRSSQGDPDSGARSRQDTEEPGLAP